MVCGSSVVNNKMINISKLLKVLGLFARLHRPHPYKPKCACNLLILLTYGGGNLFLICTLGLKEFHPRIYLP